MFKDSLKCFPASLALALTAALCGVSQPTSASGQSTVQSGPESPQVESPSDLGDATEPEPNGASVTEELASRPEQAETPDQAVRRLYRFEKNAGLVYKRGEDYRLTCDVYVPDGDGPYPAILAIHGGAWRSGSKFHLLRHSWRLARRGYVVVAINYRHAPDHPWPAQINDARTAVRWMRSNAQRFKIDPDRIGAYGYSAGGHMAALLGAAADESSLDGEEDEGLLEFSPAVQCVAAGGAPCEFSWFGENSSALAYWLGGSKADVPENFRQATPLNYVDRSDPPFYFFHGKEDMVVPHSTSEKMHEALISAGVDSTYEMIEGKGHMASFSNLDHLNDAIVFFDRVLKPEVGSNPAPASETGAGR
ncbi:MAG: alpha/beta hydrolase [Planctomycetota bacterium]